MLNRPRLLFLDEPTASLDPEVAQRIRDRVFLATKTGERTAGGAYDSVRPRSIAFRRTASI
jgi:ABC-type uncharacterized transport system ATPase subunit